MVGLTDPESFLIADSVAFIRDRHSAGWAWQQVIEQRVQKMRTVDDEVIAACAVDLGDVGNRVLKLLAGAVADAPYVPDEPIILVAEDLTPSNAGQAGRWAAPGRAAHGRSDRDSRYGICLSPEKEQKL